MNSNATLVVFSSSGFHSFNRLKNTSTMTGISTYPAIMTIILRGSLEIVKRKRENAGPYAMNIDPNSCNSVMTKRKQKTQDECNCISNIFLPINMYVWWSCNLCHLTSQTQTLFIWLCNVQMYFSPVWFTMVPYFYSIFVKVLQ